MDILEKANILSFHREYLPLNRFLAQGWSALEKQQIRFDTLLRWGCLNGYRILDLGCGYGDFREYLNGKFDDFHYLGVDLCSEFINEAKYRFQGLNRTDFICADFTSVGLPEMDIVIACGSLNYKTENSSYILTAIQRMWNVARKGVVFTLLKESHVEPNNIIMGYDEKKIIAYCRTLDANAELINDYLDEDFTVFMRRDDGWDGKQLE